MVMCWRIGTMTEHACLQWSSRIHLHLWLGEIAGCSLSLSDCWVKWRLCFLSFLPASAVWFHIIFPFFVSKRGWSLSSHAFVRFKLKWCLLISLTIWFLNMNFTQEFTFLCIQQFVFEGLKFGCCIFITVKDNEGFWDWILHWPPAPPFQTEFVDTIQ